LEVFLKGNIPHAVALVNQVLGYLTTERGLANTGASGDGDKLSFAKTTSDTVNSRIRPISVPTV
jgi:hypothetical protein